MDSTSGPDVREREETVVPPDSRRENVEAGYEAQEASNVCPTTA